MILNEKNFLLIDNPSFPSRQFCHYLSEQNSRVIGTGENTRNLLRMMYDHLVDDYCYCDFNDELSISQMSVYLKNYHTLDGVFIFEDMYQEAGPQKQKIIKGLHENIYLVNEQSFNSFKISKLEKSSETAYSYLFNQVDELNTLFNKHFLSNEMNHQAH